MPWGTVQAPNGGCRGRHEEFGWLNRQPYRTPAFRPPAPSAQPATLGWILLVHAGHPGITRIARGRPARRPRGGAAHAQCCPLVVVAGDGRDRAGTLQPLLIVDCTPLGWHQSKRAVSVAVLLADHLEDRPGQPGVVGAGIPTAVPSHLLLLPQGVLPILLLGPPGMRRRRAPPPQVPR